MFHRGAEIEGDFPSLTGSGNVARYMRFDDIDDLNRKRQELTLAVQAWCQMQDSRAQKLRARKPSGG